MTEPVADDLEYYRQMRGAEEIDLANGVSHIAPAVDWLAGSPMDPLATSLEPLPSLPGFPFLVQGTGALIVGPTGGGRSSLIQACLYDAARAGLSCAYLGHEVTEDEFNARAAKLAAVRRDELAPDVLEALAMVRYLDLSTVITHAWENPTAWLEGIVGRYQVVAIDPLSAVESALGLNFEQSNRDYVTFYDRLIQPLTARGVTVPKADNVGHAIDAKSRAKGASAKQDRADLAFSCSLISAPAGLVIRCTKVRSTRSPIRRGDEWTFGRDSQLLERRAGTDDTAAAEFRPTTLMQRVSEELEKGEPLGKAAIRRAVTGKNEYVDIAIDVLKREGFITHNGSGYTSAKPFQENTDAPADAPAAQTPMPPLPSNAPGDAPEPAGGYAPDALTKGIGAPPDLDADELWKRHRGTAT
jgi:hypothetical protein